jgi:hypothetical protein
VLEMTLKLPETLIQLPEPERDMLIRAGIHEAMRARILQMRAELAEAKKQVRRFETRYGVSLARFESEILVNQDSIQVHEDYNDWFYWQAVGEEKTRLLADLHGIDLT